IREEATRIPAAAVERLREAGISPAGLDASREAGVVRRLANEPGLRSAFRDVFGERLADDLDALLSKGAAGYPAAVAIGSTVLVPNLPDPNATPETLNPTDGQPLIIDGDAYRSRVVAELRG